jgi:hypothetical protein
MKKLSQNRENLKDISERAQRADEKSLKLP